MGEGKIDERESKGGKKIELFERTYAVRWGRAWEHG
jgi:hypothetical protein